MSEQVEALRRAARAALPPLEGEVRLEGLRGPVEVRRDHWGVPHIYAESSRDLFHAQGFVVASDRLFQTELMIRFGLGRLAEALGRLALPLDRFIRTIGWNRAAARHVAAYDERSREMAEAFWSGYAAWMEAMPAPPVEYRVLGLDPWIPSGEEAAVAGAAATVLTAWSLSRAWDNDLLRAEIAERLGPETMRALFPDAEPDDDAVGAGSETDDPRLAMLREAVLPPSGQGSNNWVVSGSRTVTGKPLLANDPHLVAQLPPAWYEVHLVAPGIDVAGVTFPFAPGVVIGHNERIAWGFTNSEADVQDLYLERLSEDAAEYRGAQEPVAVHREEIRIRGLVEPEVVEVRETRHGPILRDYTLGIAAPQVVEDGIRRTYALRWVGAEHTIEPSALWDLDTAGDWESFRAALARWHCPGQNAVYADVDGNIGYQLGGRYPLRRRGDGSLPVPGWTEEWEWEGWVSFDELPHAFNPESGFLVTANDRIAVADTPHHLGSDFLPPYRARRIAQMIEATERHSRESFARMQTDTLSLPAREITRHLLAIEPANQRQQQALELLAAWDHDLRADSAAAAIYEAWCVRIAHRVLRPLLGEELFEHFYARRQWTNGFQYQVLPRLLASPERSVMGVESADEPLRAALDEALDGLTRTLGDDMAAWRWGRVHRVRFRGRLAALPDLTDLFTAGEVELGGDEQTVAQALFEPGVPYDAVVIPSWRQIVDLADLDASVGTTTTGQSGNPESPHFRDLLPLWSAGEHHPMPFSRAAVEDATEGILHLVPA